MLRTLVAAIFFVICLASEAQDRIPAIEEKTRGMAKLDGYFPLYWDDRDGTLWLEIPRFDTDFLLSTGLAAGLGVQRHRPGSWTGG